MGFSPFLPSSRSFSLYCGFKQQEQPAEEHDQITCAKLSCNGEKGALLWVTSREIEASSSRITIASSRGLLRALSRRGSFSARMAIKTQVINTEH